MLAGDDLLDDGRLDESAFSAEVLEAIDDREQLGRIKASSLESSDGSAVDEDIDGDGLIEKLLVYGGRSFSIWKEAAGQLLRVCDSGDDFEQITAKRIPAFFDSSNDGNDFDNRSADSSADKGPEPEVVAIGARRGRSYAHVGLERVGGVLLYDVTQPDGTRFVSYSLPRDFAAQPCLDPVDDECNRYEGSQAANPTAGDVGPESIVIVPQRRLVITANETSGTTAGNSAALCGGCPLSASRYHCRGPPNQLSATMVQTIER